MELRFSKYNPKYRNEKGVYTRDEWTSFYDIGKTFIDGELTLEEYTLFENKIISVIQNIFKYSNQEFVQICQLEKYSLKFNFELTDAFNSIKENQFYKIDSKELNEILKLFVREEFWCQFVIKDALVITVGYELYFRVKVLDLDLDLMKIYDEILDNGLFIG